MANNESGVDIVGMTDKQFDSYKTMLLRRLEDAADDITSEREKKKLMKIIEDLDRELKNP